LFSDEKKTSGFWTTSRNALTRFSSISRNALAYIKNAHFKLIDYSKEHNYGAFTFHLWGFGLILLVIVLGVGYNNFLKKFIREAYALPHSG
jgi:hypothetical protein